MKRFGIPVALTLSLIVGFIPASSAAVTPGTKCSKVGAKQTFKGKIYTCIKLGSNLYWNNGKQINTPEGNLTPSPEPKPPNAPTADECEDVTSQRWKLIDKNPNGARGKNIWVYGEITQFDGLTGTSGFRADISGINLFDGKYFFGGSNTVLRGNSKALSNLVTGDVFLACVKVVGQVSYKPTFGTGKLVVPELFIRTIKYIGSTV